MPNKTKSNLMYPTYAVRHGCASLRKSNVIAILSKCNYSGSLELLQYCYKNMQLELQFTNVSGITILQLIVSTFEYEIAS